jgi:DNA integrity scanning protein DisA with diadenylate cyclase activity
MLKVCDAFANEFDVKFNPSKSKHICFGHGEQNNVDILFNKQLIENVSVEKHLGYPIGNEVKDSVIKQCVYDMYSRTNAIMAQFSNAYAFLRYELFK